MKKRLIFSFLFVLLIGITAMSSVFANPIEAQFTSIEEYKTIKDQSVLIDVRSIYSREGSKRGVVNAIWIDPHSDTALETFMKYQDKGYNYVIFCSCVDDNYSIRAAQILMKNGFQHVTVLKGGWNALIDNGIETTTIE